MAHVTRPSAAAVAAAAAAHPSPAASEDRDTSKWKEKLSTVTAGGCARARYAYGFPVWAPIRQMQYPRERRYGVGDLFGTRGDYNDGLIYKSRRLKAPGAGGRRSVSVSPGAGTLGGPGAGRGLAGLVATGGVEASGSSASAFLRMQIASTAALREASGLPEGRPRVAATAGAVLEMCVGSDVCGGEGGGGVGGMRVRRARHRWRATTDETIRRNCAVTLANLFCALDFEGDE